MRKYVCVPISKFVSIVVVCLQTAALAMFTCMHGTYFPLFVCAVHTSDICLRAIFACFMYTQSIQLDMYALFDLQSEHTFICYNTI